MFGAKLTLATLIVAIFALYHVQTAVFVFDIETRSNLTIGKLDPNDILLYRTLVTRNASANNIVSQDVNYRGFAINITYITAIENGKTQNATARLTSGGLNSNNATIMCTSAISRGFNYTLSFFGRSIH